MAQGGDPKGNGQGGPGYSIKGEFKSNGIENGISHKRGVISMARTMLSKDSAGSQFFIVTSDSTYLDGDYAAFGEVIEGMDVVDKIVNSPVDHASKDIDQTLQFTDYNKSHFARSFML